MASINPHLYLDPDQQDLLLAALASNSSPLFLPESAQQQLQHYAQASKAGLDYGDETSQSLHSRTSAPVEYNKMELSRPSSVVDPPNSLSDLGVSPTVDDLDYPFDFDESYNWDQGLDEEYGASVDDSIDTPTTTITEHEKRKSPPADYDDGTPSSESRQNEPKRREKEPEENKIAKKPGRKPLTSEPTSKRKAQNRAAQRAFRERKEKHLKDLELKVAELEKASESANKENSALRQQIERLQTELNDYRKRINESRSTISSFLGKGTSGGFQFEFPLFGMKSPSNLGTGNKQRFGLYSQLNSGVNMGLDATNAAGRLRSSTTSSLTSTALPHNSSASIVNSTSNSTSPNTIQDQQLTGFSNFHTPLNREPTTESTTRYGTRIQQDTLMSNKTDPATSPSSSSVSHLGTNSSVTSPESNSHSPLSYKQDHLEPVTEGIVQVLSSENDEPGFHCAVLDDGEATFCEKLGAIACGNPRNPVPLAPDSKLLPNLNEIIPRPDLASVAGRNSAVNYNFGDYRDTMDASFFNDAFPMEDYSVGSPIIPGTPVGPSIEPEKPPHSGLENLEYDNNSSEDEDDMVAQADNNLLSCNKIWDRINSHPKFATGELDMDSLCSALKSKAKCSETGVVVGQKDVEEVLSKAGLKPHDLGITTK